MSESKRVALVTGGGSGIGLATARTLVEDGYQVVICGRTKSKLDDAVNAIGVAGDVRAIEVDLQESPRVADVIRQVDAELGRLDVLVNAHGVMGPITALPDLTEGDFRTVLDTNLMAPMLLTIAAVPLLKAARGAVVNVSSINAIQAESFVTPYGVSKSALVGFTKYAAVELAQFGIRVNAVLPGWVRTPMALPFFEEAGVLDRPLSTNAMGRAAEPEEIAQVISFLAGPGASFMTGECVVADGGHWMQMAPLAPQQPNDPALEEPV